MSKTSKFLIAVMITALIFMSAVRVYQAVSRIRAERQERAARENSAFRFQNLPISLQAPQPQLMQLPVTYTPPAEEILLEDPPLREEQQVRQARQTITSIVDDFRQEEALENFNNRLREVSGGKIQNLDDLSTKNLNEILKTNPEIQGVVSAHLQNPDFAKIIEEIFSNPQFQQSVARLQENPARPVSQKQTP